MIYSCPPERRSEHSLFRQICLAVLLSLLPAICEAALETALLCDRAAAHAAKKTGVPVNILRALARTETGRSLQGQFAPWPWTVNLEGEGRWFGSKDEAHSFAVTGHSEGSRSFDVGCFQINYKWHGASFSSIDAMFDPKTNAVYAARFLRDLFSETGNWSDAAAAYHSRTPSFATKYKARFDRILAQMTPEQNGLLVDPVSGPTVARNSYPFLVREDNAVRRLGSLVPTRAGKRPGLWVRKEALW